MAYLTNQEIIDYINSALTKEERALRKSECLGLLYGETMSINKRPGFDKWALGLAIASSERSRDPSTKVGAVIIRPDKTIASTGYNGFPASMEDKFVWWNNRSEKYDRVIHAEMNAILNSKESVKGMVLYCTHPPCKDCAKHIAAAGIVRVVYQTNEGIRKRFDTDRSLEILKDCSVEIKEMEE